MEEYLDKVSLTPQVIAQRKELIEYVRQKLRNRNFEFDEMSYYDTGIGLELYGSFAAGLSTKSSDLDMRINDFYSYRYLNLDKIAKALTFVPG